MICPVCLEQNDHIEALMAETTTPDDTTRSYYPIGTLIFHPSKVCRLVHAQIVPIETAPWQSEQ